MAVIKRKTEKGAPNEPKEPRAPTLHDELVERACRWLKGSCGCSVAIGELRAFTGSGETPDALGWRSEYSILVECKTSRADFLADRKKPFRLNPAMGVGTYRFYLCPPGVIEPDDLPEGWGLLYVEKNRIRRVAGPTGNAWSHGDNRRFIHTRNQEAEIAMLVSTLRRIS
jgi:hypothetical protein